MKIMRRIFNEINECSWRVYACYQSATRLEMHREFANVRTIFFHIYSWATSASEEARY